MPWSEICAMEQRLRFIAEVLAGDETFTEVCERYEIARKTGYKWFGRRGRGDTVEKSPRWSPLARGAGEG